MEPLGDAAALMKWESFYVIIGSSAAALTGLQFVVVGLGAEGSTFNPQGIRTFATPTIVHFCGVLLMSAILSAPWHDLSQPAIALNICGIAGVIYTLMVTRRARTQTNYAPVFEDWLWHSILPLIAYLSLTLSAFALRRDLVWPLFVIAGAAILLLFVGIHNAWDAATYMALERVRRPRHSDGSTAATGHHLSSDRAVGDGGEKPPGKNHVGDRKHQGRRGHRR